MRIPFNQLAVFECPGFALIGIAAEIAGARVILGKESPFHAGGKSCPASSPQTGFHDGLGDLRRSDLAEDLPQRLIAPRALIIGQRARITGLLHVLE